MKNFFKILVLLIIAVLIYLRIAIYPQLDLISGFSSKSVASGHFLDNRSKKMIEQSDNDIDKIDNLMNLIE